MKTLNLHCDYIRFKALKKALKNVEEIAPNQKLEGESKDCLVVLTAIEKGDNLESVKELVDSIKDISKKINTKNIVLYPYAHLSKNLGSPDIAVNLLNEAAKKLKGFKLVQAPFGYYKEFELKVKGHPLSELSREFIVKGKEEEYDAKKLIKEISKSRLDTSKLKENDHRILGKKLDLFSFNDVAPGMVFWHDKGLVIYNELIKFMRGLMRVREYQEIKTPQILDKKLWQISGHWDKYKDNIFLTKYENRDFAVKPMNCPGGLLVYKNSPKSYKDLPLKSGEFGVVHRQELSGVLGGLFRVIQFTQDDAHIFCTEKQLEGEIVKLIELIDLVYSKFGFKYKMELSTRPEKRIGSDRIWDKAEKALKNVLDKTKSKYKINEGDGAFYGPKIDFHLTDSLGRTWQCGTIQVDFSMPERFELEYTDKNNKKKRPIMLHRAIYGSVERFVGILLEHTKGNLPFWLSPTQIKVLPMTDKNIKYSKKIFEKLKEKGFRVEFDGSAESMGKKVRDAQLEKVNYMLTIGDKEEKTKTIAVRDRSGKVEFGVDFEKFVDKVKKEFEDRV